VVLELRNNPAVTWAVDISFMADMTSSERELQMTGYNSSWFDEQRETDTWQEFLQDLQESEVLQSPGEDDSLQSTKRGLVDGPDNFDGWREKKLLRPITGQLKGSCWAHVTVIPLETQIAAHRGTKVEKLSAQEIFDCAVTEGLQETGANPVDAYKYIKEKKHLTTEKEAPEIEGPDKKVHDCEYYSSKPNAMKGITIKKIQEFQQRSVEAVKYVVSKLSPLAVYAETEQSGLEYYREKGVFTPQYCGPKPTHAMVMVGYTTDYWILMLTWPEVGDNGFVRWSRTGPECYLLDKPLFPTLEFDDEDAL